MKPWGGFGHASFSLEPFRIVAALVEKPEIGSCVVDDIFLDVLRALYHRGQMDDVEREWEGFDSVVCLVLICYDY
jgi:hypothetical protein